MHAYVKRTTKEGRDDEQRHANMRICQRTLTELENANKYNQPQTLQPQRPHRASQLANRGKTVTKQCLLAKEAGLEGRTQEQTSRDRKSKGLVSLKSDKEQGKDRVCDNSTTERWQERQQF